jgi:hypothetical protein
MSVTTSQSFVAVPLVTERGQTLTLTAGILAASVDRTGETWLDLVDDEPGQLHRWGKVMFARGAWPEGAPKWIAGTAAWEAQRDVAFSNAWAVSNEGERMAAVAAVEAEFGPLSTSHTLATYGYEGA